MAEQELNLIKLAARQVAQPGACPAQVVRCEVLDARTGSRGLDNVPDRLRCDSVAPNFAEAAYSPEDGTSGHTGAAIQSSTERFAQPGTGTVRMCLPFPTRSATTQ